MAHETADVSGRTGDEYFEDDGVRVIVDDFITDDAYVRIVAKRDYGWWKIVEQGFVDGEWQDGQVLGHTPDIDTNRNE